MRLIASALCAAFALVIPEPLVAQDRTQAAKDSRVTASLIAGGLVIVMRHTSSPRTRPTPETASSGNTGLERQLDDAGRARSAAMGEVVRAVGIPLGDVLSRPTFRALHTVRAARLTNVEVVEALGDSGQSMQGVTEAQAARLRARAAQPPRAGNILIVTHQPNLARAFPAWGRHGS